MTRETALMYLTRRADHLAKRIADAEAVGRTLTWDKGELAALQTAIAELERGAGESGGGRDHFGEREREV